MHSKPHLIFPVPRMLYMFYFWVHRLGVQQLYDLRQVLARRVVKQSRTGRNTGEDTINAFDLKAINELSSTEQYNF